jgi:CxxC motif-containing protein (DUF1111 family)
MSPIYRTWYVMILVIALVPAGLRVLVWNARFSRAVDPAMAQAGQVLFHHEWTVNDPLSAGGDGLGPVYNDVSCVACHNQSRAGGGGSLDHNVTLFTIPSDTPGTPPRQGVLHAKAISDIYTETLDSTAILPQHSSRETLVRLQFMRGSRQCATTPLPGNTQLSQRNTPALFGSKLIDEIPERVLLAQERREHIHFMANANSDKLPVGRALRLANGRVGRFGWKAQTATLSDFVQAACANELGLGNPGQAQPRPLTRPNYESPGLDLTQEQCDQLTAFCASLPRPSERLPDRSAARDEATAGENLFTSVGCTDCHTPNLGPIKGLYSDLLLHRMGQDLTGSGSYNEPRSPAPDKNTITVEGVEPDAWRTPPLWGVADSAPYLHDGRAATLEQAITMHGGQARKSVQNFVKLQASEQGKLIAFLGTLRAPP